MTKSHWSVFVFILFAAVMAVVRYIQFVTVLDLDTGFFTMQAGWLGWAYYAAAGAGALCLIAALVADAKLRRPLFKKPSSDLPGSDNLLIGLMFLIAAAGLIISVFGARNIGEAFLYILGIIGFGLCAVFAVRRGGGKTAGILTAIPALYCIIKAIVLYLDSFVILHLSASMIELTAYLFLTVFFLAFGKILSAHDKGRTRARAFFCGACAAALILSETAAKIAFWFTGSEELKQLINISEYYNQPTAEFTAMGLLSLTCVLVLAKRSEQEQE
jgi:TRAP-type mannitol/chloroaromatic compound transport system permease small subunit